MQTITSKLKSSLSKVAEAASCFMLGHRAHQESELNKNTQTLLNFVKHNETKELFKSLKKIGCEFDNFEPLGSHTPAYISLHSNNNDTSVYIEISEAAEMKSGEISIFIGIDDGTDVYGVEWKPTEKEMGSYLLNLTSLYAIPNLLEFVSIAYKLKEVSLTITPNKQSKFSSLPIPNKAYLS